MKFILLTVFFINLAMFGQARQTTSLIADSNQTSSKKVSPNGRKLTKVNGLKKADTFRAEIKDTLKIGPLESGPGKTTIYLLKDKDDNYFFMYIFPLITLLAGMLLTESSSYVKGWIRVSENGKRWIAETKAYSNTINQQIPLLDKFLAEADPDVYKVDSLQMVITLDGTQFKKFEENDLLKYIRRNHPYHEAILLSNKLLGGIHIAINLSDNLKLKHKECLDGISKYSNQVNEKLQLLGQQIGTWHLILAKQLNADPLIYPAYKTAIDLFTAHIYNHEENIIRDLFELEQSFFKPLMAALVSEVHYPIIQDVFETLAGCVHSVKGIRMERKYLRENVIIIKERYQSQVEDFSQILANIEKQQS